MFIEALNGKRKARLLLQGFSWMKWNQRTV
jgi:hypothetical protein